MLTLYPASQRLYSIAFVCKQLFLHFYDRKGKCCYEATKLAGGLGFEPRLKESESSVLPLDDPPLGQAQDCNANQKQKPPEGGFCSDDNNRLALGVLWPFTGFV